MARPWVDGAGLPPWLVPARSPKPPPGGGRGARGLGWGEWGGEKVQLPPRGAMKIKFHPAGGVGDGGHTGSASRLPEKVLPSYGVLRLSAWS